MFDIIIEANNLGKSYIIGHQSSERYLALRDQIGKNAKLLWSRIKNPQYYSHDNIEEFWALKEIKFEIKQGERIGIIGRNGSGKTTLLKILSRITTPTTGFATVKGRVASLLEVGTGFHPELTGRENIYLNGSILGMSRKEIKSKFDDIVEFSGVGKFLDTPVKRFSSGMYVRLAFSVAAHLEPEILLVDEVLAVGDAEFQNKCLGKMQDVSQKEGRTVLFVSHNMAAVETLCSKTMVLSEGRNIFFGNTSEAIEKYLEVLKKDINIPLNERKDRRGKGNIRFKKITFVGSKNKDSNIYAIGDDIKFYLEIENLYSMDVSAILGMSIRTINEIGLISGNSELKGKTYRIPKSSRSTVSCRVYSPPLNYGEYYINISIWVGNDPEDWISSAAKFSIESGTFDNRVKTDPFPILAKVEWNVER